MKTKIYEVKIHTLSPVHIGCGEYYEPADSWIDTEKNALIHYDALQMIENMGADDRKKLEELSLKTDKNTLRKFQQFINEIKPAGRSIEVSKNISDHYKDALNNNKDFNQFEIQRTSYDPQTLNPYIPGSSLKGSIRTGYLDFLANKEKEDLLRAIENQKNDGKKIKNTARKLEETLLGGSMDTDPFRLLKISDLHFEKDLHKEERSRTRISYALNKKKDRIEDGKGIPVLLEVIPSNIVFKGNISIAEKADPMTIKNPLPPDLRTILKNAQEHYNKVLHSEFAVFNELKYNHTVSEKSNTALKNKPKDRFLMRIGRYCGAESVTLEKYRRIDVRSKGGGKSIEKTSTTFWIHSQSKNSKEASGSLAPFGWVILEIVSEKMVEL